MHGAITIIAVELKFIGCRISHDEMQCKKESSFIAVAEQ